MGFPLSYAKKYYIKNYSSTTSWSPFPDKGRLFITSTPQNAATERLPCVKGAVAERLRDCFHYIHSFTTPPSRLRRATSPCTGEAFYYFDTEIWVYYKFMDCSKLYFIFSHRKLTISLPLSREQLRLRSVSSLLCKRRGGPTLRTLDRRGFVYFVGTGVLDCPL